MTEMERRVSLLEDRLLEEVNKLKTESSQAVEKLKQEFTSALESERSKTDSLQVQITELTSGDFIRKNITSLTGNLTLQMNERLTSGFKKIQSHLATTVRIFENSSTKLEKACANCSPLYSGVLETLTNHSFQISRLNRVLDVESAEFPCTGGPPPLRNGKPLNFDRKLQSIIQYECDQGFIMTGNSTVLCKSGRWEGHPPTCSKHDFFDPAFTLVADLGNLRITCYTDKNNQKIEFSRAVDTGSGVGLPTGDSPSRQKGAVLDLAAVNWTEINGAYQCGFNVENGSAVIVAPFYMPNVHLGFAPPSKVVNVGDTVQLRVDSGDGDPWKLRWRRNGALVPSWNGQEEVEIRDVQPADAGIYECYLEGLRRWNQVLLRLIVRKCSTSELYGEKCDQKCPKCYNGGICHDLLGVCICPAGFTGNNCQVACEKNHIDGDCAIECRESACRGKFYCKPDPYGCSCFPGFKGNRCDEQCDSGWYGPNCKQLCHCASGPESCNMYTGVCSGDCSPGWTGQSCQIEVAN